MADTPDLPPNAPTQDGVAEPVMTPQKSKQPKRFGVVLWLLITIGLLLPAITIALVTTESGLAALANLAAAVSGGRLQIVGVQGRLLDGLRIDRLEYADADLRLSARDVYLAWQPADLFQRRLEVQRLDVAALDLASRDKGQAPKVPTDLQLPLALHLTQIQIGRLRLLDFGHPRPDASPKLELTDLGLELVSDGQHHSLRQAHANSRFGQAAANGELDGKAPFVLTAQARLSAAGRAEALLTAKGPLQAFDLDARIRSDHAEARLALAMTPFAALPFTRVRVQSEHLDPADFHPDAPHAALSVAADLNPGGEASPGKLSLTGSLQIHNASPGLLEQRRLPLAAVSGQVHWQDDHFELQQGRVELADRGGKAGVVQGRAQFQTEAGGRLAAELDLAGVDLAALSSRLQRTRLDGHVSLKVSAGRQEFDAQLREPRFTVQVQGAHEGKRLNLSRLSLSAGAAGSLSAQGWLDWPADAAGAQSFAAKGRLENFDPLLFIKQPALAPTRLGARFDVTGRRGQAGGLTGKLAFDLDASRLAGRPLAGSGRVHLSPGRLDDVAIKLDWAGNRLSALGALGGAADALKFDLSADHLADALPGSGLAGKVLASGEWQGGWQHPVGRFNVTADALRLPGGHGVDRLVGQGELAQGPEGVMNLDLELGGVQWAGKPRLKQGRARMTGRRGDHGLSLTADLADGSRLDLAARGALTPGQGLPGWAGRIDSLSLSGAVAWAFKLAAPTTLTWTGQQLDLGRADLLVGQGQVHLLNSHWSAGEWRSKGELSGLLLGTPPRRSRPNDTRLRVGGTWDVRLGRWLEGDAVFNRESGDLLVIGDAPARLGLDKAELRLHAEQGRLSGGLDVHGTRLGSLTGSGYAFLERDDVGALPLRLVPHSALILAVALDMPSIQWLGPTLDPNLQTDGSAKAFFSLSGTADAPQGQGGIEAEKVSLALADQGLRLSGGRLKLDFDREMVRLSRLEFASPNRVTPAEPRLAAESEFKDRVGTLSLEGSLRIADGVGRFNLSADHLPLLQRSDRWLLLSGAISADTSWENLALTGRLAADGGFWQLAGKDRPRLSDDVVIRGRQNREERPLRLIMDLEADLGSRFYLRGHGVDTRLEGTLRLKNDGRGMRAVGGIKTVGGSFDAYGQSLTVQQGLVTFQGPLDNPSLNIIAMRKNPAVDAGVAVTGTALKPRIKLVSEPEVPDAEKLSWLVLGHAPDQVGGSESGLLLSAATALLGDADGGGLPRQLARGLGLDDISVSSGDLSGQSLRTPSSSVAVSGSSSSGVTASQIVSLGKRLSASTYLSYEQSLSGAGNVVKLTHNLTRYLSLVGRAGTDNTLDLLYTVSFR